MVNPEYRRLKRFYMETAQLCISGNVTSFVSFFVTLPASWVASFQNAQIVCGGVGVLLK